MAVSTSTTFTLNRTGIVRVAMQRLGVLPAGQDPLTDMLSMGADFLNILIKGLQEDGIQLFTVEHTTDNLVVGQAEYTAPGDTLDIDERTAYVSNGMTGASRVDLPLRRISRGEYDALSVKLSQSQPSQMYVEIGATVKYFIYPVPDGNWPTITYPRIKLLPDMDSSSSNLGLPSKYLQCITLGLADMMKTHFPISPSKQQMIRNEFMYERDKAANDDTERGPIKFVPAYGVRFRRV